MINKYLVLNLYGYRPQIQWTCFCFGAIVGSPYFRIPSALVFWGPVHTPHHLEIRERQVQDLKAKTGTF